VVIRTRLLALAAATALAGGLLAATQPELSATVRAPGLVAADNSAAAAKIRVATYNIHAGAGSDQMFDLDRTAAALDALDADVIGLQEVDVHWSERSQWRDLVRELARELRMWPAFGPIYSLDPLEPGQPRREYGVAVLSRFPVLRSWNHEITRLSTQEPNPVPRPMPGFLEALLWAKGRLVHAYVTHLDYRPDPAVRQTQVAETVDILEDDPRHATQVLLGDFNAPPEAPELAELWTAVDDAWLVADATSGDPATYPADAPVQRIDYVTVSDNVRVRSAVVPSEPGVVAASDHRPVVADLKLSRRD
jgi:endonuclease/exonuclease/phosphatase family metal-dependent hydrolase